MSVSRSIFRYTSTAPVIVPPSVRLVDQLPSQRSPALRKRAPAISMRSSRFGLDDRFGPGNLNDATATRQPDQTGSVDATWIDCEQVSVAPPELCRFGGPAAIEKAADIVDELAPSRRPDTARWPIVIEPGKPFDP